MGQVALVVAADIIVIAPALDIPLLGKYIAQSKGQRVIRRGKHAGIILSPGGVGIQSLSQGVLPVDGGIGERIVEIIEYKALVGQFVQRGCDLRVHRGRGKALRTDKDQVIIL